MASGPNADQLHLIMMHETMIALHNQIISLNKKNIHLHELISKNQIHRHSCREFPKFPSLPVELRRKIWQLACLEPTVHIIENDQAYTSQSGILNRSRANTIINTSKEARISALALQQHYFLRPEHFGAPVLSRNYFSAALDAFWIKHSRVLDVNANAQSLTKQYSWTCGKCGTSFPKFGACGEDCLGREGPSGLGLQMRRLVVSVKEWKSHSLKMSEEYSEYCGRSFLDVMGTLGNAYLQGAEEVFIVVEQFGDMRHEREIVFMKPSCEASLGRFMGEADHMFHEIDVYKDAESWMGADEMLNREMEYHWRRHEMVKTFQTNIDLVSQEDINAGRFPAWSYDLKGWKLPKFRFVEARKGKDLGFLSPGLEVI